MYDNILAPHLRDGVRAASRATKAATSMSDIPSGALDAATVQGGQPAVAGDPAASRRAAGRAQALHRGIEPPTRGARTRRRGPRSRSARSPRCRSRPTSTPSPRATGGAGRCSKSVVLRVELTGSAPRGRLPLQGRPGPGSPSAARRASAGRDTAAVIEFEIDLEPFEDGGWIWFDITTDTTVTVHSAGWYAPTPAPGRANVAVGIPTFNRPDRLRQRAAPR